MYKAKVLDKIHKVFHDYPTEIEHAFNVLKYIEQIIEGESLEENNRDFMYILALLHDIGIPEAQRKYNSIAGPYQEKEGAIIARQILNKIEYPIQDIDRLCYIIGNHHTASKIDGLDFQILWEADLLVNLTKKDVIRDKSKLTEIIEKNFKTNTGKKLAYDIFITEKQ